MKKQTLVSVGVATAILFALKIYMVVSGDYYFISAWFENILVIGGIAAFLAGIAEKIIRNETDRFWKNCAIAVLVIIVGLIGYWMQYLYMYSCYSPVEKEEILAIQLRVSEIPDLFAVIAILVFGYVYCLCRIQPLHILEEEQTEDISEEKVSYKLITDDQILINSMRTLEKYEYKYPKSNNDLRFLYEEQKIDCDKYEFYLVEYDEKPAGYFLLEKSETENLYKEFYSLRRRDLSFEAVNVALERYSKEHPKSKAEND